MAEKKPATKAGRKTSGTKVKTKTTDADKTQNTATQPAPKEAETAEQTTPQATQAIVTAKNGLNVRTLPEKENNIKCVLSYGAKVTIQAITTDAQGTEWAQIAPKEFIMKRFIKII